MRILAIDVGGATQDILLLDTGAVVENSVKMVMPSPTFTMTARIEEATRARRNLLFTGVNMGSGPNKWAMKQHLEAGIKVYATPEAATTFDDDLDEVAGWGVLLVSPDEAKTLKRVTRLDMKDVDLAAMRKTLQVFGVSPQIDALAVAVLDHGAAPPGVSDRKFRFENLLRQVQKSNTLEGLSHLKEELPPYLTRMLGVAKSVDPGLPLLLMDTGAACTLGAMEDPRVWEHNRLIAINTGNFHTICLNLRCTTIMGFFEHHTGSLDSGKLDGLVARLLSGQLTNEEVFNDDGHGAFILSTDGEQPFCTVTGPRRNMMAGSRYRPYFSAPHGDMMIAGCFGLIRAFACKMASYREEIENALGRRFQR